MKPLLSTSPRHTAPHGAWPAALVALGLIACEASGVTSPPQNPRAAVAPSFTRPATPGTSYSIAPCSEAARPELENFERPRPYDPWFSYTDGSTGAAERRTVDVITGDPASRDGAGHALHVRASGFTDWGAGFGVRFGVLGSGGPCALDASRFAGLRFRARGQGAMRVALATASLSPTEEGGACRLGEACHDLPGADLEVEPTWKTFEVRFCELAPEGWGQTAATVDPRQLFGLHFRLAGGEAHEVWLDDLAFFEPSTATQSKRCGPPCPLAAVPPGAVIAPGELSEEHRQAGLGVHTFAEPTGACGQVTRRYLDYVPKSAHARSVAPVVILLHGLGASAESFRDFQTHARFEALSERDGFIVVYANAAPGRWSNARVPNSGGWRIEPGAKDDVDDFAYLELVRGDLRARGVIDGTNAFFLVGQSNGGGMVLEAARRAPDRYRGFAALMPYAGARPLAGELPSTTTLNRVLFAVSRTDPGLPKGYVPELEQLAERWANTLGIPETVRRAATEQPLPNTVNEGADYTGTFPNALATRSSRGALLDWHDEKSGRAVRLLVFDHAGHFWPNPLPDTLSFVLERWGFRNRDVDAADLVWDFLRDASVTTYDRAKAAR